MPFFIISDAFQSIWLCQIQNGIFNTYHAAQEECDVLKIISTNWKCIVFHYDKVDKLEIELDKSVGFS